MTRDMPNQALLTALDAYEAYQFALEARAFARKQWANDFPAVHAYWENEVQNLRFDLVRADDTLRTQAPSYGVEPFDLDWY